MNGTQQTEHRTAIKALRADLIKSVETIAEEFTAIKEAVDADLKDIRGEMELAIEHTQSKFSLELVMVQADLVNHHAGLAVDYYSFKQRTFWQRVKWLLTGK